MAEWCKNEVIIPRDSGRLNERILWESKYSPDFDKYMEYSKENPDIIIKAEYEESMSGFYGFSEYLNGKQINEKCVTYNKIRNIEIYVPEKILVSRNSITEGEFETFEDALIYLLQQQISEDKYIIQSHELYEAKVSTYQPPLIPDHDFAGHVNLQ